MGEGCPYRNPEDYSPCPSSDAPAYSAPNLTTGDGTGAFTTYDGYGNVAREADRAQVSVSTYDARNRLVEVDRQVAVPGASDLMASRYAPHVFTKKILGYSEANRPLVSDTGADTFNLQGAFGDSELTVGYALDGSLETATSSYGALISDRQTDAIGQTFLELFGDAAGTLAYMTDDYEGRLTGYDLQRSVGPWAGYVNGGPPSSSDFTLQSTLAQLTLAYDMVGNPVSITQSSFAAQQGGGDGDDGDGGIPGTLNEWPQGGLPTTSRTMTYWDDYRLNAFSASYDSPAGDDISGLAGNPYTATELSAATYPAPGPVSTGNRVRSQTFGYDLRGNVLTSTDDANDLWDRSLGPVTYVPGSDQLATTDAGGAATYDAAGNVATLTTATGATFELLFDEVGRLTTAVREDASGTIVSERYTYDAGGERVLTDETPAFSAPDQYTVDVFDSLVLKGATFPDPNGDYQHDDSTENVYFNAGGQAVGHAFYAPQLPSATGPVHVFLTMQDPSGSTSFVIDQGTSEVVEAARMRAGRRSGTRTRRGSTRTRGRPTATIAAVLSLSFRPERPMTSSNRRTQICSPRKTRHRHSRRINSRNSSSQDRLPSRFRHRSPSAWLRAFQDPVRRSGSPRHSIRTRTPPSGSGRQTSSARRVRCCPWPTPLALEPMSPQRKGLRPSARSARRRKESSSSTMATRSKRTCLRAVSVLVAMQRRFRDCLALKPKRDCRCRVCRSCRRARWRSASAHAIPPNAMYTVTPWPGTWIQVNPTAAALFGQSGGLPEVQFLYGTTPGTVSLPFSLPW